MKGSAFITCTKCRATIALADCRGLLEMREDETGDPPWTRLIRPCCRFEAGRHVMNKRGWHFVEQENESVLWAADVEHERGPIVYSERVKVKSGEFASDKKPELSSGITLAWFTLPAYAAIAHLSTLPFISKVRVLKILRSDESAREHFEGLLAIERARGDTVLVPVLEDLSTDTARIREFVDVMEKERDHALARACVGMCAGLGIHLPVVDDPATGGLQKGDAD